MSHYNSNYEEAATYPVQTTKSFTPFWFEGGFWFQMVNNELDLQELLSVYRKEGYSTEQVMSAQECIRDESLPRKFGFASECTGGYVLGEYLALFEGE